MQNLTVSKQNAETFCLMTVGFLISCFCSFLGPTLSQGNVLRSENTLLLVRLASRSLSVEDVS